MFVKLLLGMSTMYKKTLKVLIFILCLISGFFFAKVYQPEFKTVKLYNNALNDYDNENYSNSYYLFSKVGYLSVLKPVAIFRQAMCARALGDRKSELNRYNLLIKFYPSNKLANESRYLAGQILIDENPKKALKYFEHVLKSDMDSDYKLASEYYIARINASKIRYSKSKRLGKKKEKIEAAFRKYLEQAPDGRLAVNVANSWVKFNPDTSSGDSVLISRAYYLANAYDKASVILSKAEEKDSWAISGSNLYKTRKFQKAITSIEDGVSKYSEYADTKDYKMAVDNYVKLKDGTSPYQRITKLLSLAKGKNKDYIWKLKCDNIEPNEKYACYSQLYASYPKGDYAEDVLFNMFNIAVNKKDYSTARLLAKDFLSRFPESDYTPQIMFWAGRIEQQYYHTVEYTKYFQELINKYPDSYYAYRAFLLLKGVKSATIPAKLEYKPVSYPYKYPSKNDILYHLLEVKDYDMVVKFTKDEFIRSWCEHQKGNYASSLIIARDAMAKLKEKPIKSDLRWRLVYPQNYYKQVKNYADIYKNNDALMMAIIREESSFNSVSQSAVGAIGLMQLMPATAHDIGEKHGITFNTSYLFNPELNIRLGNLYYSTIRSMLDGKDVSAIAAYNGGIGSVTSWKKSLAYSNTDEFVEQIPYEETKNYVMKVFKSYWNYTRIYQQQ